MHSQLIFKSNLSYIFAVISLFYKCWCNYAHFLFRGEYTITARNLPVCFTV